MTKAYEGGGVIEFREPRLANWFRLGWTLLLAVLPIAWVWSKPKSEA
jgi:hypothetical protein